MNIENLTNHAKSWVERRLKQKEPFGGTFLYAKWTPEEGLDRARIRREIATAAMQGLLAHEGGGVGNEKASKHHQYVAEASAAYADALIAELNK